MLIIARESLIATLMSSLVELAGCVPAVPHADESPVAAITRTAPDLLLLDCEHDAAASGQAVERARAIGAAVLLYTPARTRDELEHLAALRGVEPLTLPVRPREFTARLRDVLAAHTAGEPASSAVGLGARKPPSG